MTWIAGIVVVLALVWLSLKSPGFRVFVLVAVVLVGAGIWWFVSRQEEKARLASELIKPSEVQLSDLSLRDSVGTRKVFTGRVKNLSTAYTLSTISLRLTAYDCPGQEVTKECDIIGQADVTPALRVPPGEVRTFDEYVSFANMPKARNFRWSYVLDSVRAQVD
jgi:hypothetical protein